LGLTSAGGEGTFIWGGSSNWLTMVGLGLGLGLGETAAAYTTAHQVTDVCNVRYG